MLRDRVRGAREGRYDAPRHVGCELSRCVESCEIGNFGRASQPHRGLLLGPARLVGGSSPSAWRGQAPVECAPGVPQEEARRASGGPARMAMSMYHACACARACTIAMRMHCHAHTALPTC